MHTTITEYNALAIDANGVKELEIGDVRQRRCTSLTAVGSVTLRPGTRFVRVATDTSITFDPTGVTVGDLIPANTVSLLSVIGGTTVVVAAG